MKKIEYVKPHRLLAFGLLVAAPLLFLLRVYPPEGVHVFGDLSLVFPSFEETFYPVADSAITASVIHSTDPLQDETLRQKRDSIRTSRLQIHYPGDDPSLFYDLFESLRTLDTDKESLHVLHFGGSQIEGDRITEHLRSHLQEKFGGSGPGWLPAVPYVGSRSFLIEYSDNWSRYALYGLVDSTIQHNHYGALGIYARFSEEHDSTHIDTIMKYAWIEYKSRYVADEHVKSFDNFTLFYGFNSDTVALQILGGRDTLGETIMEPSDRTEIYQLKFRHPRRDIRLEFSGREGPEVYGVSLRSTSGVVVSNISMRGQAGTHFWTQPEQQLKAMFSASDIRMIILQYGANVVPYMATVEEIEGYTYRFGKNIEYLKNLIPGVSVIVIGPADMAEKLGTKWVSYPILPHLRDAMRESAFASGAAYWDPYEAMGGAGTIMDWASADPPLAVNDHVHFTIEGAEIIAQWFYDALIQDYEKYLEWKECEEL